MSTRATYKITEVTHDRHSQCFYIHHDGYPSGAVEYFKEMLGNYEQIASHRPGKLITAFSMIPNSEFTESHDSHGDTKYNYNLFFKLHGKEFYLVAYKITLTGGSVNDIQEIRTRFFDGTLQAFIDKYKE
jgi:hypothetical protein